MYDVYLTCIGDGEQALHVQRIEISGIQSRIRIESFSFQQRTNNEKQKNQMKTKVEQK
jgi:hypothetical protein